MQLAAWPLPTTHKLVGIRRITQTGSHTEYICRCAEQR